MRSAGLNPLSLFGAGGGSPAPSPQGNMQNPLSDFSNSATRAMQLHQARQGLALTEAQTAGAQAAATRATAEAAVAIKESRIIENALDSPLSEAALLQSRYGGTWLSTAAAAMQAGRAVNAGAHSARDAIRTAKDWLMPEEDFGPMGGRAEDPTKTTRWREEDPWAKRLGYKLGDRVFGDPATGTGYRDRQRAAQLEAELNILRARQEAAEATAGAGSSAGQKREREGKRRVLPPYGPRHRRRPPY